MAPGDDLITEYLINCAPANPDDAPRVTERCEGVFWEGMNLVARTGLIKNAYSHRVVSDRLASVGLGTPVIGYDVHDGDYKYEFGGNIVLKAALMLDTRNPIDRIKNSTRHTSLTLSTRAVHKPDRLLPVLKLGVDHIQRFSLAGWNDGSHEDLNFLLAIFRSMGDALGLKDSAAKTEREIQARADSDRRAKAHTKSLI